MPPLNFEPDYSEDFCKCDCKQGPAIDSTDIGYCGRCGGIILDTQCPKDKP